MQSLGIKPIEELMKAVDETIPQPERPKDKPFLNANRGCVFYFWKRYSCDR